MVGKKICLWSLMTTSLLLSGCGDDEPAATPVARDYSVLTAQTDNAVGATWREGDCLAVYSLASTSYCSYVLASSPGLTTATFSLQPSSNSFADDARCYALTAIGNVYGISGSDGGYMKLTYRLPAAYDAEQLTPADCPYLMNVPFWGEVTFDSNGRPSATLRALTAFLAVDLSTVPDDAQSLLITTHSSFRLNGSSVAGGAGEPLAGNFDCLLGDEATLAASTTFRYKDVIQIVLDLDFQTLGRIYIPIPAGKYERLHVVALAEDYYNDYEWKGTLLATYDGQQFTLNSIK